MEHPGFQRSTVLPHQMLDPNLKTEVLDQLRRQRLPVTQRKSETSLITLVMFHGIKT